jgi:hypothetical protein
LKPPPPKDATQTQRSRTASELTLEDTEAQQRRGLSVKSEVVGYNPYDTGPPASGRAETQRPGREPSARKPTDLRALSEWIRAQRRAEALRNEESAEAQQPSDPTVPDTTKPQR